MASPIDSPLSQPLLKQASSLSGMLDRTSSVLGRSPHRVYRCWPSSAGLDLETDNESDMEPENLPATPRDEEAGTSPPLLRKPSRVRRGFSARLGDALKSIAHFPVAVYQRIKGDPSTTILACKVGFSCCLTSLLVFWEDFQTHYSGIAIWAVVTIALVYEANIGASISKGLNRVTGTFIAGAFAVLVNHVGPLFGPFRLYFVLLCVFLVTWIPVFLRFGSPLKEHWNYALSMATITAHLLILSGYKIEEKLKMPITRFLMIVLGFLVAAFVNLAIKPKYAGDSLHKLVTKNFKTAADILEQVVSEYLKGTELEPVPDILSGRMKGDGTNGGVHRLYDEIVMSDTEVDKLMNFVAWEPCHGRFFRNYPWAIYGIITDNLRYTVYTVIALDGCLRAEIQAPQFLRDVFAAEIREVGAEICKVLRVLHQSLAEFRTFAVSDILQQAEVSALLLQMKLHDNAHRLLLERARTPSVDAFWKLAPGLQHQAVEDRTERSRHSTEEEKSDTVDDFWRLAPGLQHRAVEERTERSRHCTGEEKSDAPGMPGCPGDEELGAQAAWQREFFLRRDSLGKNWEGALERIGAMSLVKFASLMIELVAGLQFLVESVDLLSQQARFEGPDICEVTDKKEPRPVDLGEERSESKKMDAKDNKGRPIALGE